MPNKQRGTFVNRKRTIWFLPIRAKGQVGARLDASESTIFFDCIWLARKIKPRARRLLRAARRAFSPVPLGGRCSLASTDSAGRDLNRTLEEEHRRRAHIHYHPRSLHRHSFRTPYASLRRAQLRIGQLSLVLLKVRPLRCSPRPVSRRSLRSHSLRLSPRPRTRTPSICTSATSG